jgi:exopolyphosphatase / guanosine-5'-triphosphate,3'-diphosphate pyrophosphatase
MTNPSDRKTPARKAVLAAIDMGSNSFRLEISELEDGHLRRLQYLKEAVRQGAGLDKDRNLTPEAMEAGWTCLARFAERLKGFQPTQVSAVATQTLREARNSMVFQKQAELVLGFPIDIVSGKEEARLIYQGVSYFLPATAERRLVIDIGGRSTEFILGLGNQPQQLDSYRVGSVSWSSKYFVNGSLKADIFKQAEIAAASFLEEAHGVLKDLRWDKVYGSSGTIGALAELLSLNDLAVTKPYEVTLEGLLQLKAILIDAGHIEKVRLNGLKDDRRPVIAGGLSVMLAIFRLFDLTRLEAAEGALRHGVLYELADLDGKRRDLREQTISSLMRRFSVDVSQSQRVAKVARHIFSDLAEGLDLADSEVEQQLIWAARLHELGAAISHENSHRHGAYILENTDAIGFARSDLHRIGLLVLGQKGKVRKLEADLESDELILQLLALRMAIILAHARTEPSYQTLRFKLSGKRRIKVHLPAEWAEQFPQSHFLLSQEQQAWEKTNCSLTLH